jgi:cell division protein FtsB
MSTRAATSPTVRPTAAGPRVRISARASVLLVVILIVGALSIAPMRAYLSQRDRLAQLEGQAERLEAHNRELERQIARLHDPVFLDRLDRQCLGMVHPGEIAFATVSRDGEPNQPDC